MTSNTTVNRALLGIGWAAGVLALIVSSRSSCKSNDSAPVPQALFSATAGAPGCTEADSIGAHPNDGLDDRPAIQSWLDAQPAGCLALCFGPGKYEISKTGGTTHRRIVGLSLERPCLTLSGAGQATVLMGIGDGGGESADFSVISIKGANHASTEPGVVTRGVELRDMRVSADDTFNTGEQTHVIEVGGRLGNGVGVEQVLLHNLWLDLPPKARTPTADNPRTTELRGDCVRLIGSAIGPTRRVHIESSVFTDCDRSSVGIQREVYDTLVRGNLFLEVGDTHIDEEPTGTGPIERTVIDGNLFRSEREEGHYSITVTGNDQDAASADVMLLGNVIEGRGIMLDHVRRAIVSSNTIHGVLPASYGSGGLIEGIKALDQVLITGNVLRRASGSPAGPLIRATYHATVLPGPMRIAGNMLEQGTVHNAIDLNSIQGASVEGNDIVYQGDASAFAAVMLRGDAAPVDRVLVSDNRVSGRVGYLLRIQPSGKPVGYVGGHGNAGFGATAGLRCEAGLYDHAPVWSGNIVGDGAATSGPCPPVVESLP